MAIVEVQFREGVFFDILRAQIVRFEFPVSLLNLGPGRLIERIEAGESGFSAPGDPVAPVGDGELLFKIAFTIHHTSFVDAHAAGSLQVPATQQIPCKIWINLSGEPPTTITWSLSRLEISGVFTPTLGINGTFPLGSLGVTPQSVALVAGAGVVALRFGTQPNDLLVGPVANGLAGADWGYFAQGQVFADEVAAALNSAVQDAVKDSSDPVLEINSLATGFWSTSPPVAFAAVEITAVDAIPVLNTDVPVRITAQTAVSTDMVLHKLVLNTTIHWYAHDFITTLSSGAITLVQNKVSDAVLKKLKAPPGQQEVGRDSDHVTYRSSRDILEPRTSLFFASVQQALVDGTGLRATGTLTVYPPPVAFFTLEDQHWHGGIDCSSRSWRMKFYPAAVHIFCPDRYFDLRIRSNPVVDPADVWNPSVGWTGFGPGIQVADIVFEPPYPMKPAGTPSAAYLDTNLGVRYVNLGPIPAEPAPPGDPIVLQAAAISECMAISSRFGAGVLNVGWVPDPPDLNLGLGVVREWTITAEGVVDLERVEVAAIGEKGTRSLRSLSVNRGAVSSQVITDANESLQIRSPLRTLGAPPSVMQRWIVVWARTPVESGVVPLALWDGALWAADAGGLVRIEPTLQQQGGGASRARAQMARWNQPETPGPVAARLKRAQDGLGVEHRTISRGRIVAVLHRGEILFGLAGPLVPAMEPTGRELKQ